MLVSEAADRLAEQPRLKLYRLIVQCRALEKRAYDLFIQNLIKGTSHLALGQEAVTASDTARNSPQQPIGIAHPNVWADGSAEWRK